MKNKIVKSISALCAFALIAVAVSSTDARPIRGSKKVCSTVTVCDISAFGYCLWSHEEEQCVTVVQ